MIVDKVKELILKDAETKPWDNNVMRCSSAGNCVRQLAYRHFSFPISNPMQYTSILTMELGHTIEEQMMRYCDRLGAYDRQLSLVVDLGDGIKLSGHIDGLFYDKELDKTFLIDWKSINDRGAIRAEKGTIDEKYKIQMCLYMKALKVLYPEKNIDTAILLYYNKNISDIFEAVVIYDEELLISVKEKYKTLLASTPDTLPMRAYRIDDKGVLPWNCGTKYCQYSDLCYPNKNITFSKTNKPKFSIIKGGKENEAM